MELALVYHAILGAHSAGSSIQRRKRCGRASAPRSTSSRTTEGPTCARAPQPRQHGDKKREGFAFERAHRLCCFPHKAVHLAPCVSAARRSLHARGGGVLGARRARGGCDCGVASGTTQVDQHRRDRRRQRLRRRAAQKHARLRAARASAPAFATLRAGAAHERSARGWLRGAPGSAQRRAACLLPRAAACVLRRAERRGPAVKAAAARAGAGAAEAAAAVCASQQRCRSRVALRRRRMTRSATRRRCCRPEKTLRRAAAAQCGAQSFATPRRASNQAHRNAARVSARIPTRPWP